MAIYGHIWTYMAIYMAIYPPYNLNFNLLEALANLLPPNFKSHFFEREAQFIPDLRIPTTPSARGWFCMK